MGEYWKGGIRANGEYQERVESGRVPEMWNPGKYRKCGIRTGTENVEYGHVLERFESGLVPKRWNPGKCRKGGIWVSTGEGSE